MKVGIVTFTYGDNYGQRLQNLAVQELLRVYFNEVYTIPQVLPKTSLKRKLKKYLTFGPILYQKRSRAFREFDNNYITYYTSSISENTADSFPQDEFDYFIAGSDQIWSPYSPDVNSTMFLSFVDKPKRIALAPSISANVIPDEQKEKYKSYFEGFSHLSIREEKGAEIINELTGINPKVLIDPTLMHKASFWDKYIKQPKSPINEKYACCYFLGIPQKAEKIEEICRRNSLKRIDVLNDKEYKCLGPQEFLYLIKNAAVVITDSYHGCVFSCIFHISFIMCERKGTDLNMNSRFNTLFNKLGINKRRLQEIEIKDALNMNFDTIDERIEFEIEKVKQFLDAAFTYS